MKRDIDLVRAILLATEEAPPGNPVTRIDGYACRGARPIRLRELEAEDPCAADIIDVMESTLTLPPVGSDAFLDLMTASRSSTK